MPPSPTRKKSRYATRSYWAASSEEDVPDTMNASDVLGLLKDLQRKQNTRASKETDWHKKLLHEKVDKQTQDFRGKSEIYINTVKGALNGLRRLEWDPQATFGHLAAQFRIRTKHAEGVLRVNHDLVLKASEERLETIEKNSSELCSHKAKLTKAGSELKRVAKKELEECFEQRKNAMDAQAYIKYYRQLLLK